MQVVLQTNDFNKEDKKIYLLELIQITILLRNIVREDSQFNFLPSLDIVWRSSFIIRFTWLFFRIGLLF